MIRHNPGYLNQTYLFENFNNYYKLISNYPGFFNPLKVNISHLFELQIQLFQLFKELFNPNGVQIRPKYSLVICE